MIISESLGKEMGLEMDFPAVFQWKGEKCMSSRGLRGWEEGLGVRRLAFGEPAADSELGRTLRSSESRVSKGWRQTRETSLELV